MPQYIYINRTCSQSGRAHVQFLLIVGAILLCWPSIAPGQQIQDSLELGPVKVEATRISLPPDKQSVYINLIDSTTLQWASQQSIADVLSQHTSLDIKNYGPGGTASVSQRGMEADQTQVLWNGIPLNLSFLGLSDLSLLDAEMFSEVEVTPGNMSSSFGGRSIGGTVMLNTHLPDNQVQLSQGIGAYGYDRTFLKTGYKQQPWKVGILARRHHSNNDFTYQDPITGQKKQRGNNQTQSKQVLAGFERNKSGGPDIGSVIWLNRSENHVPGATVAGAGTARQTDNSLRWIGSIEQQFQGWTLKGKGYFSSYELDYVDPQTGTDSQTLSRRTRLIVDTRKHISDHIIFNASASAGITGVETSNYENSKRRQLISLQSNPVIHPWNQLYIYPAVRYDYYSDFGSTISPSLGASWSMTNELTFRISGGYNFSPPTFNDLYWEPGGNPALEPERSRKVEAGVQWGRPHTWYGRHDLSAYYIRLTDGIQWQMTGGGVWSPRNVKRMVSRGLTWRFSKSFTLQDIQIRWNQILDWTQSEITRARFQGDDIVGNQLSYVPRWKYKTNLTFKYENYRLNAFYQWTGVRYTDNSHQSYLNPYKTMNISAGYVRSLGSFKLISQMKVENVMDENYQLIQWYPMPGRHLRFTVTINYSF